MIKNTQNMFWSDIHAIKRFSENTQENKNKEAKKTSSIILASVQLMENYIKGLKNLSAYDASSIILSDANWIKRNSRIDFLSNDGNKLPINIGTVYYIDFGNSFSGELAYFHHGLCVGKKEGKALIVPMTSGQKYFSTCYHPVIIQSPIKSIDKHCYQKGLAKIVFLK